MQNIQLIGTHYPDWKVYLYVSPDVDSGFLRKAASHSNVVIRPTGKSGVINRIERFFAIDEPDVETMFVRDADSRVHWKDRWAVNDFISKPEFVAHIIRDNREHDAKMLAGLWGIHKTAGVGMKALFELYMKYPIDLGFGENGMDQSFLISYVYPCIHNRFLLHYSNKCIFKGESGVEFPFQYNENFHCGRLDGPDFADTTTVKPASPRLSFVNGRFKVW